MMAETMKLEEMYIIHLAPEKTKPHVAEINSRTSNVDKYH